VRKPTLTGFTKHLLEYKHIHTVLSQSVPKDFYLDDIDKDVHALYDPELPPFLPDPYVSDYAEHLKTVSSPYVLGAHWYVLSCAHASGGPAIADSLGFSSYFLRRRDVSPLKTEFTTWTSAWKTSQRQECIDAIPEVFQRATMVNDMIYHP
jgi:hypothetical protein